MLIQDLLMTLKHGQITSGWTLAKEFLAVFEFCLKAFINSKLQIGGEEMRERLLNLML